MQIEGKAYALDSDSPLAREGIVTPGYFDTFQTPVVSGREFTHWRRRDQPARRDRQRIVCARALSGSIDAVGHQFKRVRPGSREPWLTIVGVVPDLLMEGIGNNNASPVGYYIPDLAKRRRQRRTDRACARAASPAASPRSCAPR